MAEDDEEITIDFMTEKELTNKIAIGQITDTYLISSLMKYFAYQKHKQGDPVPAMSSLCLIC